MEVAGAVTGRVSLLRCCGVESVDRNKKRLAASVSVGDIRRFWDDRRISTSRLSVSCGEKKERKEKRKMVKGLEKDLEKFIALGFGIGEEAADVLLRQLQCLREAEEDAKRRRKLEKKQSRKAMRMQEDFGIETLTDSEDGECERSIDFTSPWKGDFMSRYAVNGESSAAAGVEQVMLQSLENVDQAYAEPSGSLNQQEVHSPSPACSAEVNVLEEASQPLIPASHSDQSSTFEQTGLNKTGTKKVEICMGGKCKKSGGEQLLEKFQRLAEKEEDVNVVGCKCMGKCKNGPNVRLSAINAAPAICSGVGIGDIEALMISFLDLN